MLYLKKFNQFSEYENYINSSDVVLPNVSYIENDNIVMYNPLGGGDDELLEIAGTAIVYDTNTSKLKPIAGEAYNTTDYPQDVYIPVGVIVMPASHTEDGYARMMSLKLMGVKTLDDGSITYGAYDATNMTDYDNMGGIEYASPDYYTATGATEGLINYYADKTENFPVAQNSVSISYNDSPNSYELGGNEGMLYYTNVDITDTIGPMLGSSMWIPDGDTGYGWNSAVGPIDESNYTYFMPSPYNADGTPNMNIRAVDTNMEMVHGKKASDMVIEYAANTGNRFDIFEATNNYSTDGTNQGDWYVPSPLELSYFSARMKEIYSTLNKMNPNFGEVFDTLLGAEEGIDFNYLGSWSSTLYSSSSAWGGALPFNCYSDDVNASNNVFGVSPVRNL